MKLFKKVIVTIAFIFFTGCLIFYFGIPAPIWDHSPEKLVIFTSPGVMHINIGYFPDVKIWGNGDIVWSEYSDNGQRNVYTGHLSQQEIRYILDRFIKSGVFNPFYKSESYCQYLGQDNWLEIKLRFDSAGFGLGRGNSRVCELTHFLSEGAGAVGTLYRPQKGWLHVLSLEDTDIPIDTKPNYEWPEKFLLDLNEVRYPKRDIEISGDVLEFAWEVVNSVRDPVILSKGKKYWIAVIVPEIRP